MPHEPAAERTATAIARTWVWLYTLAVPSQFRDERRAEITSDLWEHKQSTSPTTSYAIALLQRLIRGMPADLAWSIQVRLTQRRLEAVAGNYEQPTAFQNVVIAATGAFIALIFLLVAVGVPTVMAAAVGAIIAAASGGIMRQLMIVRNASDADDGRSRRRKRLIVVLLSSVLVLAATALYAFSLEEWGDVRGLVFNLVGIASVLVAVSSLVMLLADTIGSRRRQ